MQEKDTLDHQPARHRLHDGGDDPQHQLVYHSPHAITLLQWDIANLLNSASRVSVPLFL